MAIMVEREQQPQFEVKSGEEIELPEHLKVDSSKAFETAAKANVKDGGSQVMTQTPTAGQQTLTVPADTKTLKNISKGPITSAVTWLAAFWLRAIKKALHLGWRVVGGNGQNAA